MKILIRTLDGINLVEDTDESSESSPGVRKLADFLQEIGMNTYDRIGELAQVLKVPVYELRECADRGCVEDQAAENIFHYWRNCRIPQNGIEFLNRQSGTAGEKNVGVDPDHFDFKDNCG